MKLECPKEKLYRAISIAEKVTGKNLSLPALSHVLLKASGRYLSLTATNLDVGLRLEVPAKVETEGSVMVSGAILSNFLANLGRDEKVSLTSVGENISLQGLHHSGLIKVYPQDDFPTLPKLEAITGKFTLAIPSFVAGLKMVAYAAALSDIKPEIASVYLYQREGELNLVATDSFRLAEKHLPLEQPIEGELKLMMPVKNVADILRVLEGQSEPVEISYNNHQMVFSGEGYYLTSRLVEGIYPDYRQIVPVETKTGAVVLKNDLQNALKLSHVFADRLNQVSLRVAVKDALFELNSHNTDLGESTTKLEATLQGEDLEISFNVRYLLDCLAVIPSDSVSLRFNGRGKPILVSGIGDNTFTYLIMPLNR
ncbi:MAG: DNA polymerase III subunit beta [Patescibacteria group bacterium]|nr:DNA polymerase III subunit beta [Patescibacteria group bacterium]